MSPCQIAYTGIASIIVITLAIFFYPNVKRQINKIKMPVIKLQPMIGYAYATAILILLSIYPISNIKKSGFKLTDCGMNPVVVACR